MYNRIGTLDVPVYDVTSLSLSVVATDLIGEGRRAPLRDLGRGRTRRFLRHRGQKLPPSGGHLHGAHRGVRDHPRSRRQNYVARSGGTGRDVYVKGEASITIFHFKDLFGARWKFFRVLRGLHFGLSRPLTGLHFSHILFIPDFFHFPAFFICGSLARGTFPPSPLLSIYYTSQFTHILTVALAGLHASLSLSALTRRSAFTRRALHIYVHSTYMFVQLSSTLRDASSGSFVSVFSDYRDLFVDISRFFPFFRFFHAWLFRSRNARGNLLPLPLLLLIHP